MQQELLGSMGEVFSQGVSQFQDVDEDKNYEDELLKYGKQMVQQMIQRSKLPPDTELTLREFCDMVWRAGTASALDYDHASFNKQSQEDDDQEPTYSEQDL